MGKKGRARVLGALSWEHSTQPLLDAYARIFGKMGR